MSLELLPCPVPGCRNAFPHQTVGDDPLVWCGNKYCGLHDNSVPASIWQNLWRPPTEDSRLMLMQVAVRAAEAERLRRTAARPGEAPGRWEPSLDKVAELLEKLDLLPSRGVSSAETTSSVAPAPDRGPEAPAAGKG